MRSAKQGRSRARQQGAALVIGLILLMVLTLLAVSSMNTASLEFIMAGNEQYRSNAFQAAEAGIEQSIVQGAFNPDAVAQQFNGNNTPTDTWRAQINLPLGNVPQPALWGNSWNAFSTYHFEVVSTGASTRGATARNAQGVAFFAPYSPSVQNDPNLPSTALK
jgi:type IV pilus assembly protein PilX